MKAVTRDVSAQQESVLRPPRDGQATIAVRDLRKSYGDLCAVDGVTAEVGQGEFFGILGPNGAGKTTTLEIIEGLRQPDGGEVSVLDMAPWPRNPAVVIAGTLAFMSIGLLVGAVSRTQQAATSIANLIILPMAFLGGASIPLAFAPNWIREVS